MWASPLAWLGQWPPWRAWLHIKTQVSTKQKESVGSEDVPGGAITVRVVGGRFRFSTIAGFGGENRDNDACLGGLGFAGGNAALRGLRGALTAAAAALGATTCGAF